MNILIVHNNKNVVDIIASLVKKCIKPNSILKSHTVNAAINKVIDNKIDFIFLDLNIETQLDGIQLFRKIKKINQNISVVLIISENNSKMVSAVLDIGPMDYIVKPLSLKKIENSILTTSNA